MEIKKNMTDVSEGQMVYMQEPKISSEGKLTCPVCNRTFSSRQEYDNHWLGCHPDPGLSLASGSMGSFQASGKEKCEEPTDKH